MNGLADPVEDLESVEEVNRGRLDCLQEWTDKRLDIVVISMPHRDPFRLLCECFTSLSTESALLQLELELQPASLLHLTLKYSVRVGCFILLYLFLCMRV